MSEQKIAYPFSPEQTMHYWKRWERAIEADTDEGIDFEELGFTLPLIPVRDALISYCGRNPDRRERIVYLLTIINRDVIKHRHPVCDAIVVVIAMMNDMVDLASQVLFHIRTTFDEPYPLAELMVNGILGGFTGDIVVSAMSDSYSPEFLASQAEGEDVASVSRESNH